LTTTYTNSLPTDKDWVRFQVYDRESPWILQDEEITAILAEESNKWVAAARCGEIILARTRGVIAKKVAETTTAYGIAGSILTSSSPYQEHLSKLRKEGMKRSMGSDGASGILRIL
jgi:hypothetical protein